MPRVARVVGVGHFHHITQRGNNRANIFFTASDRIYYLSLISKYCGKYNTSIAAYCLMDNHIHFIVVPGAENSLALTFNTVHMCYAQYIHKKMGSSGHLWQGRFFSCLLEGNHLLATARYVERNPVRANMVHHPWDWKWSSASCHIGKSSPDIPLVNLFDFVDFTPERWKDYINKSENDTFILDIRRSTKIGLPLGTDNFILNLEKSLGKN
ncbi:MAG: transposase [Elusimicrobia bacterium]|nr:transposase [Elusimicrobiota bacterium]